MFLKNIKLVDFRGLNIELSFINENESIRHATILLGENGVGKSNLLKAIALITAGSDALSEIIGHPDDWISFSKNRCAISATLVNQNNKHRSISLKLNRGDTLKDVIINNLDSLNEIDNAIAHATRNYFVLGYGATRRLNRGYEFNKSGEKIYRNDRAQNIATLFSSEALLNPLSSWAMELDYKTEGKNLVLIEDVLNDLLTGVRFKEIDKNKGDLMFLVGTDVVPLHLLSEGYQNVAAWLGDLLYRITNTFKDYYSPLETRGILLIDEIDLHLHPKWQRYLLKYIKAKFPKLQLITTTHSAITAQQTREGELYFLNKDEHGLIRLDDFRGNPSDLLIHQLLLSPAFGLVSDESLKVQEWKDEYREIKMRKKSGQDEKRLKELSSALNALPQTQRTNFSAEPGQMDVILEVRKELLKRKGE